MGIYSCNKTEELNNQASYSQLRGFVTGLVNTPPVVIFWLGRQFVIYKKAL